jgi:plastocyanin
VVSGRRLNYRAGGGLALLLAGVVGLLLLVPTAEAANRRIALSNYQWSDQELDLDLGEHVTWYWIGPDTMHSITGTSPNALDLDSDPNDNFPDHPIGDTFKLSFHQPGVYKFHCKLHSLVRGEVAVSDKPGNPGAEPIDPVPSSAVDLTPPSVQGLALARSAFGKNGTALRYSLDERARLTAEFFALRPRRKPRYAGYTSWRDGHIGLNSNRFGKRRKHFKAKPGKYMTRITATDRFNNTTRPVQLKFRIWQRSRGR